jgi:hypothetical protein
VSPLLFLGDSVAAGQAVALRQALAASGVELIDATSTGGGNLVGPNAEAQQGRLPTTLAKAEGGVVAYQLTTFDWGTEDEQRAAYDSLAQLTSAVDAELLLISMPPIESDDFYAPHMHELAHAADAARATAERLDNVEFLDASAVWGDEYARDRDGKVDRSEDGVHTCPQGAARFASWLLEQLAALHPGFTPADSEDWANTGWSGDPIFHGC